MAKLSALQDQLGYVFVDPSLLQLALTHPSIRDEATVLVEHNQRLEFLGDAVLGLVLTAELYRRFPGFGEGPLSKARAQLVNRRTLAEQAKGLALGDNLNLSRGDELSGGRARPNTLADAFEALLGAVFIDGGYEAARSVILHCFREEFGELPRIPNLVNPKGELQELLQAESPHPPLYEISSTSGPDHDRIFEGVVFHRGVELGRGTGKSKQAAESQAALVALEKLRASRPKP